VTCGNLEVGDPAEGFANFGDFPYTVSGFTYDIQDLVFLEYCGAPDHDVGARTADLPRPVRAWHKLEWRLILLPDPFAKPIWLRYLSST